MSGISGTSNIVASNLNYVSPANQAQQNNFQNTLSSTFASAEEKISPSPNQSAIVESKVDNSEGVKNGIFGDTVDRIQSTLGNLKAEGRLQGFAPDAVFPGLYADYGNTRFLAVLLVPTDPDRDNARLFVSVSDLRTKRGVISTIKSDGTMDAGVPIKEISDPITDAFKAFSKKAPIGDVGRKYFSSDHIRAFANIRTDFTGPEGTGYSSGFFSGLIFDVSSNDKQRGAELKNFRREMAEQIYNSAPYKFIEAKYGKRAVEVIKGVNVASNLAGLTSPISYLVKKGGKYVLSRVAKEAIINELADSSTFVIGPAWTSAATNIKIVKDSDGKESLNLSNINTDNARAYFDEVLAPVLDKMTEQSSGGEENREAPTPEIWF